MVVACIGAGLVGRAWAIVFARAGHEVRLFDETHGVALAAVAFAREVLPVLKAEGLLEDDPDAVVARMHVASSLAAALEGADHIQESTPEQLEVKRAVFAELDRLADLSLIHI